MGTSTPNSLFQTWLVATHREAASRSTEACVGLPPIRRSDGWISYVWQRSLCVLDEDFAFWSPTTDVRNCSRQLREFNDVGCRHRWLSCRRLPDGGCGCASSENAESLIVQVIPSNDTDPSRDGAVELLFEAHPAPFSLSPALTSLQSPSAILLEPALK